MVFSHSVNEALHLSEDEDVMITQLMNTISKESEVTTDLFSHQIIIKQIELLLNYCDRFYHRQFLTRKQGNSGLLSDFEDLLNQYFDEDRTEIEGIQAFPIFLKN